MKNITHILAMILLVLLISFEPLITVKATGYDDSVPIDSYDNFKDSRVRPPYRIERFFIKGCEIVKKPIRARKVCDKIVIH